MHTRANPAGWGIHDHELVTSTLEAHLAHGVDEWKAAMCRQHGVEIFFEDGPSGLRHVDPRVVCSMPVDPGRTPETARKQMRASWQQRHTLSG